jgi:hypothetical protein
VNKTIYYFPFILFSYLIVAVLGKVFYEKKELYPFASWSLYTKTPSVVTRPALLILEVNGVRLSKPIDLSVEYHSYGLTYSHLRTKLDAFYQAFLREDQVAMDKLGNDFKLLLGSNGVNSFQLVLETYYPYEKLRKAINLSSKPLTEELRI